MSNIDTLRRKAATVTLSDGIERPLKFSLNSFALMEEQYGSVDIAMNAIETGSIKAVRFMLWAGIVDESPELTEMMVGKMIEITELPSIIEKLNAVMGADSPVTEEGSGPNQEVPK